MIIDIHVHPQFLEPQPGKIPSQLETTNLLKPRSQLSFSTTEPPKGRAIQEYIVEHSVVGLR